MNDIQAIAHQEHVHIHLVAHSRKGDNDEKPPRLHDVKGTSEICDMAENVLSVWKNKKKIELQSQGNTSKDDESDAILLVDSQRNGDGWTGAFPLWFDRESFQFLSAPNLHPLEFEGVF
ncbi:MAG: hypothetical protein LBJ59_02450 [Zoogloeaceae bacterium]|nr:hypothetical protein [Zoogloeaceae bacterium]